MNIEKGKLLYKERRKKYKLFEKMRVGGIGILTLCIGIFLLVSSIMQLPLKNILSRILCLFLGSIFTFLGMGLTSIAFFGTSDLEVYEKGIVMPSRPFREILRRKENFQPFNEIIAMYLNTHLNSLSVTDPYIILTKNKERPIVILRRDIGNMDRFEKIMQGKILIIRDRDWHVERGIGECLHPPNSVKFSDEGIHFEYPQKELFILWNDIKRIVPYPVWAILHKDGTKMYFCGINDEIKKKIFFELKKHR